MIRVICLRRRHWIIVVVLEEICVRVFACCDSNFVCCSNSSSDFTYGFLFVSDWCFCFDIWICLYHFFFFV